ncbi:hypothetical protein ACIRPX_37130 [Streptomyces sp. NPDC101225]|uniref:hypothetical protein n=1 Tax=Streptomyces sp. NPDC101225 TaxID=3366135 RepID=UPI00380103E3
MDRPYLQANRPGPYLVPRPTRAAPDLQANRPGPGPVTRVVLLPPGPAVAAGA